MKIGIFTDSHYSSQTVTCGNRYNSQSLRKIKEAYEHFQKENCDLIVCLGDLIDHEDEKEKVVENLKAVAEVLRNTPIPSVCVMGNHDAFTLEVEEFYRILGTAQTEDLLLEDCRLLFLDACYLKNGRHYQPGDDDWTDTYYPFGEQLLEKLRDANEKCYVFLHQNIDPAIPKNHRLWNDGDLFCMINKSGVVKAVFQGHYHPGCQSEYAGVPYIALPAMCENEGAYFVFEL